MATVSTPQLRPYQFDAVAAAESTSNGLLVLATGAGKSLVIGALAHKAERAVILQPSVEILESNLDKARAFGIEGISVYSASAGRKDIGRITYGTIGSLIKAADEFEGVDLLCVDEAHLLNPQAGQYLEFVQKLKPRRLIGLTASPYRLHTIADVSSFRTKSGYHTGKISDIRILTRTRPKSFKKIVHVTEAFDLIQQGFLHEPDFITAGSQKGLKVNTSGSEFDEAAVRAAFKKGNMPAHILDCAKRAADRGLKHILIFVPNLDASDGIVKMLCAAGISADNVSGETPKAQREDRLRGFRSGRIRAMVNVGVLTTGWDFPELDCIIVARPTMSLGLWYQVCGRIVRCHPDKHDSVIYDLSGNFARFGNPFRMRMQFTSTGLPHIIGPGGRLTGRALAAGPECEDAIDWGKFAGTKLKDLPTDYIQWCVANNSPSEERHQIEAEYQRRTIFQQETANV